MSSKKYDRLGASISFVNRPVFMIWREEAFNVGKWLPRRTQVDDEATHSRLNYVYAERHCFAKRLQAFKWWAGWVRDALVHSSNPQKLLMEAGRFENWAYGMVELDGREDVVVESTNYRGAQRVALGLRACELIAELSANEPEGYLVGQALGYYLDHGLLLADVHINNIGEAERDGYREPLLVITDPGHAVSVSS